MQTHTPKTKDQNRHALREFIVGVLRPPEVDAERGVERLGEGIGESGGAREIAWWWIC